MKRRPFALILIITLLLPAAVGTMIANTAKANWIPIPPEVPPPLPPKISIISPESKIFSEKEILLSFSVKVTLREDLEFRVWNETTQTMINRTLIAPQDKAGIPFISYTLDGAKTILKNLTTRSVGEPSWEGSTLLTCLSEGTHTLTINASGRQSAANLVTMGVSPDKDPILYMSQETYYSEDVWSSSEITFIIDATSPVVSILSPKNNSYHQSSIFLNFSINESVPQIEFSLDGQSNVTITGNTTLPELAYGSHTLAVYVQDSAGYFVAAEMVYFSIVEPFPTTIVLVLLAIIVGVGIFTYFKKIRKEKPT